LILRPAVKSLAWDDFERAGEAIDAGIASAMRALPRIQKLLGTNANPTSEIEEEARSQLWLAETLR